MANIEIVIKMDEKDYERINTIVDMGLGTNVDEAIKNGTPLPKGHGRLIDADRIVRTAEKGGFGDNRDIDFVLSYIPKCKTIIEADE